MARSSLKRNPAQRPSSARRSPPRPAARPLAEPGSRRRLRREGSEARILAAAEEIFAETGFSGATTAMIAERAGLPKANVHYYFGTKERLYRAVLERILEAWLASGDQIQPDADPATALAAYVAAKVEASRTQPYASKVFANEILHGAPQLADYLRRQVRDWVEAKGRVLTGWAKRGLIRPVEAEHLFFVLWAATQTYADFEAQVRAVLGRERLLPADYRAGAELITRMALAACGIAKP
jgi:TetR/AcrR family transcriptional regulator